MEQIPSWEANQFSASQEVPLILWNLKVHYRFHKVPLSVYIMSQLDPFHVPKPHILKIHLNIVLPSTPGSSKWFPSHGFPHQNPVCAPSTYVLHAPPISFWFYHPCVWWGVWIIKLIVMSFSSLSRPLRPKYSPITLFSNTLSLFSSLNTSDQVSHLYKTTCKVIVLYVLIFREQTGRRKIQHRMIASIPQL
jgi:hypothetical protein